jgi:hypothetical protein
VANEIEIHITAKDDASAVLRKVATSAKAAGRDAGKAGGDAFSGSFSGNLDLDKATAKITKHEGDFERAGDGLGKATARGYEKGSRDTEKATEKVAKRANATFSAMAFTGLSAGLPAAAAVGAAGATAALAAVPLLFAGIGAAALASDLQVSNAFSDLTRQVTNDTKAMAQPLKGELIDSTNRVRDAFVGLRPQISAAMLGSRGAISTMTDGVIGLARNAMPGLVVAVSSSRAPLVALSGLLAETGTGLSDMFRNMSAGSQGAAAGLTVFSHILREALGFVGSLLANLANGSVGPLTQFQGMLHAAEQALLNLTSAGSPVLGFLTGFGQSASGALTALQGLTALLNMLPAGVGQFAGSLIAASMIMGKFGLGLSTAFAGFGTQIAAATGVAGKFQATLSGLLVAGLSPAGLAVGALGVGLALLGRQQEMAAAEANKHQSALTSMTSALRASGGAMDASVRSAQAQTLANTKVGESGKSVLEWAKSFGLSLPLVTDAAMGVPGAMDQVNAALETLRVNGKSAYDTNDIFMGSLRNIAGATGEASAALQAEAAAASHAGTVTGQTSLASQLADKSARDLAAAFDTMGSAAATAADRGSALQQVLDVLNGRTPSYEEATQQINDAIRSLGEQFKTTKDHADGYGRALINADGTVNTVTKNGSTLQNTLVTLQGGFANAGASINELVTSGMSLEGATARVNGALAVQRQRFIDSAGAMGLTKAQATTLADKYGLIPNEVTTQITQPGMPGAQQAADILRGKVVAVPDSKTTIARALTGEAIARLQALGYEVIHLPNGDVRVVASGVSQTEWAINNAARDRTSVVNVVYRGRPGNSGSSNQRGLAEGGLLAPFAAGGIAAFDNGGVAGAAGLSSSLATFVPRGTKRLIGDNMSFPELFAPLNGSERTARLINQAAEHEGLSVGGSGSVAVAGGRGGGGGGSRVVLEFASGGSPVDELFVQLLRRYVRVQGGDVQAVIGQ